MRAPSLLFIYLPHNLLPALTAAAEFHKKDAPEQISWEILLWTPPHLSAEQRHAHRTLVERMIAPFSGVRLCPLTPAEIESNLAVSVDLQTKVDFLREKLGADRYQDLFFSHDLNGDRTSQALMQAFPKATRVCYGDSLGTIYSRDYMRELNQTRWVPADKKWNLISWLKALVRYARSKSSTKNRTPDAPSLDAQVAALLVPSDPGGDFLAGKSLVVPPKGLALSTAQKMLAGLPEFSAYLERVLAVSAKPISCFVLSNLTESSLTTPENEVALYKELILAHVPRDHLLLIKQHSSGSPARAERLAQELKGHCEVRLFEVEFLGVPMELASALIARTTFLSISYTSISLKYLYGARVRHVLTDELIDRYFIASRRYFMKAGNDLYIQMLGKIDHWDGKTLLVSGR